MADSAWGNLIYITGRQRTSLHIIVMLVLVVSAGCGRGTEPSIGTTQTPLPSALPPAAVRQMIAQPDTALGAQVFADNCTACHGRGGRGDGRLVVEGSIRDVPDFTDPATMTVSDPEAIFQIITYGRLEVYMPPWGGVLSEEARWAVTMDIYGLMQGYRQAGTDARSAGR